MRLGVFSGLPLLHSSFFRQPCMAVGKISPNRMLDPVQDDDFFALMEDEDLDGGGGTVQGQSTTSAAAGVVVGTEHGQGQPHQRAPTKHQASTSPHRTATHQARSAAPAATPSSSSRPTHTHAAATTPLDSPMAGISTPTPGPSTASSSHSRSRALRGDATHEHPSSPSVLAGSRRFPGPAGALPPLSTVQLSAQTEPRRTPKQPQRAAQADSDDMMDFAGPGWRAMCAALGVHAGDPSILGANIGAVRRGVSTKIPNLVALLKQIKSSDTDASVVLKDPSGEVRGTVHHRAVEMFAPDELAVGAVVVLRQVSVFAPSPRSCHLNITPDNIVQLFTASGATIVPTPRGVPGRARPADSTSLGGSEQTDPYAIHNDHASPRHPSSPVHTHRIHASAAPHTPAPAPAPPTPTSGRLLEALSQLPEWALIESRSVTHMRPREPSRADRALSREDSSSAFNFFSDQLGSESSSAPSRPRREDTSSRTGFDRLRRESTATFATRDDELAPRPVLVRPDYHDSTTFDSHRLPTSSSRDSFPSSPAPGTAGDDYKVFLANQVKSKLRVLGLTSDQQRRVYRPLFKLCLMLLDLEGRPRAVGHIASLIEKNAPQVIAAACPDGNATRGPLSSDPAYPMDSDPVQPSRY
eukprot:m.87160 g.87160  ORF g.87160 m.87160 type:complete len:640 (+) comp13581_c2_seq2:148-2067(+)